MLPILPVDGSTHQEQKLVRLWRRWEGRDRHDCRSTASVSSNPLIHLSLRNTSSRCHDVLPAIDVPIAASSGRPRIPNGRAASGNCTRICGRCDIPSWSSPFVEGLSPAAAGSDYSISVVGKCGLRSTQALISCIRAAGTGHVSAGL